MAAFQPSKVFAELMKSSNSSPPKAKRAHLDGQAGLASAMSKEREIQVWATGEMSLKPDRCRLCIRVTSTKDNIDEAKTSVSRRVDYVVQTLHNHGVKVGLPLYQSVKPKEKRTGFTVRLMLSSL